MILKDNHTAYKIELILKEDSAIVNVIVRLTNFNPTKADDYLRTYEYELDTDKYRDMGSGKEIEIVTDMIKKVLTKEFIK